MKEGRCRSLLIIVLLVYAMITPVIFGHTIIARAADSAVTNVYTMPENPVVVEADYISESDNHPQMSSVTTWDTIYFGHYPQRDTSGDRYVDQYDEKLPIRWRVLNVDDSGYATLISDKILESGRFHETYEYVTWETSDVRKFLNEVFYTEAFSDEERGDILPAHLINEDNPEFGTDGGRDTDDKVFLLSISEATNPKYGFGVNPYQDIYRTYSDDTRVGLTTFKARYIYHDTASWFLRTPGAGKDENGNDVYKITYVGEDGYINQKGINVDNQGWGGGIRPAIGINIKTSKNWTYAGKVRSDIRDQASMLNTKISLLTDSYEYTGEEIKAVPIVKYHGTELKMGTDYTVRYVNNIEVGKATAIVTGVGLFYDEKSIEYTITPSSKKTTGTSASEVSGIPDFVIHYDDDDGYRNIDIVFAESLPDVEKINITLQYYDSNGKKLGAPVSITQAVSKIEKNKDKKLHVPVNKITSAASLMVTVSAGSNSSGKKFELPQHLLVSDFWGYKNFSIEHATKYLLKFMGPMKAAHLDDNCAGGTCYGMVTSGLVQNTKQYPGIGSWESLNRFSYLSDLTNKQKRSTELNLTAMDFNGYAHAIQNLPYVQNETRKNMGDLNGLYNAVKKASKLGLGISVRILQNSKANPKNYNAHQIAALVIAEDTDKQVKIRCYDPNSPKDTKRYLILKRNSSREFTEWSYKGVGKTYSGKNGTRFKGDEAIDGWITFENHDIAQFFVQEYEKVKDTTFAEQKLLYVDWNDIETRAKVSVSMNQAGLESEDILIPAGADGPDHQGVYYYVDKDDLNFAALPAGTTVSLISDYHSASVETPADADVSLHVADTEEMKVSVCSDTSENIVVVLRDTDDSSTDIKKKTITMTTKAGQTAVAEQTASGVKVTSAASYEIKEEKESYAYEDETGDGSEQGSAYQISVNGEKVTLAGSDFKVSRTKYNKLTVQSMPSAKQAVAAVRYSTGNSAEISEAGMTVYYKRYAKASQAGSVKYAKLKDIAYKNVNGSSAEKPNTVLTFGQTGGIVKLAFRPYVIRKSDGKRIYGKTVAINGIRVLSTKSAAVSKVSKKSGSTTVYFADTSKYGTLPTGFQLAVMKNGKYEVLKTITRAKAANGESGYRVTVASTDQLYIRAYSKAMKPTVCTPWVKVQ